METEFSTPADTAEQTIPQSEPVSKLDWHAPTIIRIDIKRTMGGSGAAIDLAQGSQPT